MFQLLRLDMQVQLTRTKTATIDDEAWEVLRGVKWFAYPSTNSDTWYARTHATVAGRKGVMMHRAILGVTDPSLSVDHIDGDGLNNRRANLRVCSNSQNQFNTSSRGGTSRFKGVSWFPRKKKWRVTFTFQGRWQHVGYFEDELEAALAYNEAVLPLAGEFARLNDVRS